MNIVRTFRAKFVENLFDGHNFERLSVCVIVSILAILTTAISIIGYFSSYFILTGISATITLVTGVLVWIVGIPLLYLVAETIQDVLLERMREKRR